MEIVEGEYIEKIIVAATLFPVPDIFPPNIKVEIVVNPFSNQKYKLIEQTLSNEVINVNLIDVSSDKRVIHADSVNVNGLVKISFESKIGLLESNQLNLLNGGRLSVTNYKINNSIVVQPKTSSSIEKILLNSGVDLEIHWIKNDWPIMMIGCEEQNKRPSKIKVILDEDFPAYDQYYDFTYHKSHTILTGMFNCDKWKDRVHFESKFNISKMEQI